MRKELLQLTGMPGIQIDQLLDLQQHDIRCEDLRSRLRSLPEEIRKIEAMVAKSAESLELTRSAHRKLELRRKEVEGLIATLEARANQFRTQQLKVKKNEEYSALEKEIENALKEISQHEDQALDLLLEIDEHAPKVAEAEGEHAQTRRMAEQHIGQLKDAMQETRETLQQEEASASEALTRAAPELARMYEFVKNQVKRPPFIVSVSNQKCQGCHIKISGERESLVRKGEELVRCDNCGRIIYMA